jgi:hypothetical protein
MSESSSFEIILASEGEGGNFRVKDYEDQRPNPVDRMTGKFLSIKAELMQVVHGTMTTPDGDPASLIIIDFQFLNTKSSRRFESVEVIMRFSGAKSERSDPDDSELSPDPEVVNIEPRRKLTLLPTTKKVDLKRSAHATVQGGASGANVDVGYAWDRSESFETENSITVTGLIRQEGRDDGRDNTVRWAMMENPDNPKGVPSLLRTATLLRRGKSKKGHSGRFQATVEIEASVDFVSTAANIIDRVRGKIPVDGPVLFDPRIIPKYPLVWPVDKDRLGEVNLPKLIPAPVISMTTLSNTVESKAALFTLQVLNSN